MSANGDKYQILSMISKEDLSSLSIRQQQILVLRYKYKVTGREVGELFNISKSAIYNIEVKIFQAMRLRLRGKQGGTKQSNIFQIIVNNKQTPPRIYPPYEPDGDWSCLTRADLPKGFNEQCWAFSMDVIIKLLIHLSGARVFIPKKIRLSSALTQKIGYESACIVVTHIPGEMLYVPMMNKFRSVWRNINLRKDYDNGVPRNRLVQKYNLSYRQINSILSEP